MDFTQTRTPWPQISPGLISLKLGASALVLNYPQAVVAFREWSVGIGGTFRGRTTASLAASKHQRPTACLLSAAGTKEWSAMEGKGSLLERARLLISQLERGP